METKKTIITDDMVLGYRDYTIDRKTKKDFFTLDSVVEWIKETELREAETTKEFYDFAEQEYGIDRIIERMKTLYPEFPFGETISNNLEEEINLMFNNRDKDMHASQFTEAKIPQNNV